MEKPRISQSELNIEDKTRSNPLTWKGQFSPQLVEAHLKAYGKPGQKVLDPFAGSGTVLLEAIRHEMVPVGMEVNPAAVTLARLYCVAGMGLEARRQACRRVEAALGSAHANPATDSNHVSDAVVKVLATLEQPSIARDLAEAVVVASDLYAKPEWGRVMAKWKEIRDLILGLPLVDVAPQVHLADARRLPLGDNSVDLVLTSPPYINVFNYHQQYRASTEAIGWEVLPFARSEIGANRKFRGNRLLTVIQYCLDMALCLREVERVLRTKGRAIFVIGRESNVRKTAFFNAEILSGLAEQSAGLEVVLRQERVFRNRFGQSIFEDILHLRPTRQLPHGEAAETAARSIAAAVLQEASRRAPDSTVAEDFSDAIERISSIPVSDFLDCTTGKMVPASLHRVSVAACE